MRPPFSDGRIMATKPQCLGCGGKRDRGPYTKYCKSCFIKPCRRCGEPNLRGPYTTLCDSCKELPPLRGPGICTKCGQKNDRGGRTRICSACTAADTAESKRARIRQMNSEARPRTKWCSSCESYRPTEDFYTKARGVSASASTCKQCNSEKEKSHGLTRYNITEAQYLQIFEAQGGGCAICKNKPTSQRLAVDHDHETGMVRGLLCTWCNHKTLGGARDNIDILRAAMDYLMDPPAVKVIGEVFGDKGGKKRSPKRKTGKLNTRRKK